MDLRASDKRFSRRARGFNYSAWENCFLEMLFSVGRPQLRQVGELMSGIDNDR